MAQGRLCQEVCGLKLSGSGQRLASGGKDSLVHLWDLSSSTQWLHRLMGHTSAVKALVWCPFQSNLLASGVLSMTDSPDGCTVVSAAGDETLMFWNAFGVLDTAKKNSSKSSS
ncbi:hypothetical protein Bca4012_061450 [Brassica carinata]